ncbi:MAG: M48 family metallopeptidase [Pseudomonadota bacterium]
MTATYYSGQSSQPHSAEIAHAEGMLEVYVDGDRHAIPLADVDVEPPLAGMAQHLRLPGGDQLELEPGIDISPWFDKHSRLERIADWLEQRWPIALGSLVVTIVAAWAIYAFALPAAANVAADAMPMAWKRNISDQSVKMLRQLGFFSSRIDEERQQAIRDRFAPMIASLPNPEQYTLEFRRAPVFGPNAFAMPGGRMVVLDALVQLTDDNDEIVAILAHELGHAYHQHPMRMALQSSALGIIATVTIGDVSGLASIPLIGLQSSYSREFEGEADDFAIDALRKAGMSPQDLANAFIRLRDALGIKDEETSIFATHPALEQRILKAAEAAKADAASGARPASD